MKLEIFLSHNIVKNHSKHIEFCIMFGPETGNIGLSESFLKKSLSRKQNVHFSIVPPWFLWMLKFGRHGYKTVTWLTRYSMCQVFPNKKVKLCLKFSRLHWNTLFSNNGRIKYILLKIILQGTDENAFQMIQFYIEIGIFFHFS